MVSPEDFGSTNPGSIPGAPVKGDVCHVTFYLMSLTDNTTILYKNGGTIRGTTMDIKRIKNNPRYEDYIFFDEPAWFEEYFNDKDYPIVQIHDINPISSRLPDPIGFVGRFRWKANEVISLDGDSYTSHMLIYGLDEFEYEGQTCLNILTDRW